MFNTPNATVIPAATYTLAANLAWFGYDTNYTWSVVLTIISSVIQAVLCGVSWTIFDDQYNLEIEQIMRMEILSDDDSADEDDGYD